MPITPPAAKILDDENDLMEVDVPPVPPGDEADVESEGGTIRRKSETGSPKESKASPKSDMSKSEPVVIPDDVEEGDEDDEEDADEETFAVEEVLNHRISKKANGQRGFKYYIKWLGYDKESDNTWEDEENCEGSQQLVDAYWKKVGGKPTLTTPNKGPGRKRNLSSPASDGLTTTKKRRESTGNDKHDKNSVGPKSVDVSSWKPPAELESWDDKVADIETVERTDNGLILVYLNWKNGRKSCHDTTVVYQKCPQKMLQFYESHLVFKQEAEDKSAS